jgi:hypothetical protein
MADPDPASREELTKMFALSAVRVRLLKSAYSLARHVADAQDLVGQVRVLLLEGGSPWKPDRERPLEDQAGAFVVHASLLMRRIHIDRLRSREVKRTKELTDHHTSTAVDGRQNIEEQAVDLEWEQEHERHAGVWIAALRERMAAKDKDAPAVIDKQCQGVDDPRELADALGWKLRRVELALRRIAYHAPLVRAEQLAKEREEEERRIAAARAADAEKKAEKNVKDEKGRVQP